MQAKIYYLLLFTGVIVVAAVLLRLRTHYDAYDGEGNIQWSAIEGIDGIRWKFILERKSRRLINVLQKGAEM